MKIALIGCSASKLAVASPARDLYTGQLFRKAREWAEANCDQWFILSALYGLLEPDREVETYDVSMSNRKGTRNGWGVRVVNKLTELGLYKKYHALHEFVVLAGAVYAEPLKYAGLEKLTLPLKGLGIGQQLAWFNPKEPVS